MSSSGSSQSQQFAQACASVDEAARLTKESTAYANLLAAQWRKLGVDRTRQAFEAFGVF